MKISRLLTPMFALVLPALAATPVLAAGTVQVNFVEAKRFTDLAEDDRQSREVQAELAAHLQRLAERHLPDGRSLQIDLLDVDRAGSLRALHRHNLSLVRVMRGGADWPVIKLRYVLRQGERVLAEGEDTLQDMHYLQRLGPYSSSDALRHEKRLLDRWFAELAQASGPPG